MLCFWVFIDCQFIVSIPQMVHSVINGFSFAEYLTGKKYEIWKIKKKY